MKKLKLKPPDSYSNEGGILTVTIEKNTMIEFSDFDQIRLDKKGDDQSYLLLDAFLVNFNESFSTAAETMEIPGVNFFEVGTFMGVSFVLDRKVSQKDINDLEINEMPGFRVIWSYDKQISETPFVEMKLKDEFVK